MPLAVIDASAAVDWVLGTSRASRIDDLLNRLDLVAPEIIDAELLNALRRRERLGAVSPARADAAVVDWTTAPVERVGHIGFLWEAWGLRHNLTASDAMYVALARAVDCELITADRRLASAPNLGIVLTVVA
jgi:predicted nucleic acid-binding protein